MNDLASTFSIRSPDEKAIFLARVAHMATVIARNAYAPSDQYPNRNFDNPDAIILRDEMLFVHRVVGYIMPVLKNVQGEGQDASVMTMIVEHFKAHRIERFLYEWLELSEPESSSLS